MNTYPILLYHQLEHPRSAGSTDDGGYAVSPAEFEMQMRFLAEHGYECVSCEKLAKLNSAPQHGRGGRKFAITFDDGYRSVADVAFPILQRYGFTATVFVVTGRVGTVADWVRAPALPLLSVEEIRELAAGGLEFGSHTHTHPDLTSLSTEAALQELMQSREVLSTMTGTHVTTVAYPYGATDGRIRALAAHAGYQVGFSLGTSGAIFKRIGRGLGLIPPDPLDVQRRQVNSGYDQLRFRILLSKVEVLIGSIKKAGKSLKRIGHTGGYWSGGVHH